MEEKDLDLAKLRWGKPATNSPELQDHSGKASMSQKQNLIATFGFLLIYFVLMGRL